MVTGQSDVCEFLKSNSNQFFTADHLSKVLNVSLQSIHASLRKSKGFVVTRYINSRKGTKHKTMTFGVVVRDVGFEGVIKEVGDVISSSPDRVLGSDSVIQLLILKELKEIKEVLKNGDGK